MTQAVLFAFESEFVARLECIPMAVRFKLDRCGVKLSLQQWSRLTVDDRRELLDAACDRPAEVHAYRVNLIRLVQERSGEAAKTLPPEAIVAWDQSDRTPTIVTAFARSIAASPPSDEEWASLADLQRFALLKLVRDNHDNVNFLPAMLEFGLRP